ncbi:unnamed protein product [Durusdinium trenchii]|uniref:J domain-containing protein n=2 Tax=Durusdinium trenchii TaxID=1381693 RepID=A0ABP0JGN8_9DINO
MVRALLQPQPWRLVLLQLTGAFANSLVGPGAVGSYQGGGGGRRFGGFARVTDPPVGFFLGGSSIRDMNGLYSREHRVPNGFSHTFTFSYRHDYTGWRLCLVGAPEDVKRSSGRQTEWVLIDPDRADRFRHDGDQLIPGSGHRWSHVHRTKSAQPDPKAGSAVAHAMEDDEEELPWQLVGVGEEDMLRRLKRYFTFYKHEVQAAIDGQKLPKLPVGGKGTATSPPEGFQAPKAALPGEEDGTDTCLEGSASLENAEAELQGPKLKSDHWSVAMLQLRRAICYRRRREFQLANDAVDASLVLYPRYAAAIEELGKLQVDQGLYERAIHSFETLLRVDRKRPFVGDWLVRVHGHKRRQETEFLTEKPEVLQGRTPGCIAWRQTGGCSPTGLLEPSADKPCNAVIAKGNSGFCQCATSGARGKSGTAPATAAESDCEHEPFTCAAKCAERQQAESGHGPKLTDAAAQLAAEVSNAVDVQPCTLLRGGELPEWCQPNHYLVLGIRCDFPDEHGDELKRAYKKRSLQYHPDKLGGSAQAFQRVADSHQVLLDPEKRRAFDEGADFPRKVQHDGAEGETHKEEIEKKYFPERFDFAPFGDPHSDRREAKARQQRLLETKRQEALAREAKEAKEAKPDRRTDL